MMFKSKLSFYLSTAASIALSSAAYAQTAPAPEAEEIVITGFRASLQNSLNLKRDSNLIAEAVTAEDAGKMPDQDVAESLQRLPGVQIDRNNGEGTKVLIRGLNQNITLFDGEYFLTGLEAYAEGEASGSGQGNTNTNSLESIPVDLLSGIDVYKTPSANMVEGALGGIVNLKSRSPLDSKLGLTLGGKIDGITGDNQTKGWGEDADIVGTYNWHHVFGVAASVSYQNTNTHTDSFENQNRSPWGQFAPGATTANGGVNSGIGAIVTTGVPVGYTIPEFDYVTSSDINRERISSSVEVEWAPTESLTLDASWVHAHYNELIEQVSGKIIFLANNGSNGSGLVASSPYSVSGDGAVLSGVWGNSSVESDTDTQNVSTTADNFRFLATWDNGGQFRAKVGANYSSTTYKSMEAQQDEEHTIYPISNAAGQASDENVGAPGGNNAAGAPNFLYFNFSQNGTYPTTSWQAPYQNVWSNPAYEISKSAWAWQINSNEYAYVIKADGEYDANFIPLKTTISAGVRYADKNIDYVKYQFLFDKAGAPGYSEPFCSSAVECLGTYGYYDDPSIGPQCPTQGAGYHGQQVIVVPTALSAPGNTTLDSNKYLVSRLGSAVLAQNPNLMKNPIGWIEAQTAAQGFTTSGLFKAALYSFDVDNKTDAGYIMADMGSKSDRFHLNYGVRMVQTTQTVGTAAAPATSNYWGDASWEGSVLQTWEAVSQQRTYTDILPDFNAVFDVTEDQKLRFSGARVMAPPNPYALGNGLLLNYTSKLTSTGAVFYQFVGGSGGNPNLDPFRATQVDLDYEYYLGRKGALTGGVFYKAIDSFNTTGNTQVTEANSNGTLSTGAVNTPVNGLGGNIKGVELGGQYSFDNGFGINANYTYSLSYGGADASTSYSLHTTIPGVSLHAATVQGYYEAHGFEGRISYTWKSGSFNGDQLGSTFQGVNSASTANFNGQSYGIYQRPYGQMDGQVAYSVNDHAKLVAQFINITDATQSAYLQFKDQPMEYQNSGRTFIVGVNWKL
jgi:TonB-dependent receptor